MQITDDDILENLSYCSPRFECIINAKYIGNIWAFKSDIGTIFDCVVYEQFVGVMHQNTEHESVWEEGDGSGWIEDGTARKGLSVSMAYFDDFSEALDHLMGEIKRLLTEQFGRLDAQSLSV